ncbi:beta-ketoacyl-[acyl-carrier-protein] synthase family protein [Methylobacter sp. Wu1]|uniref:beta-ketoacyl-[acyl-carrier-protein] synthase family protein n=1 Tax=Methylobacter sp. Wu1 TaxID=3119359 RepID=UPI002F953CD8
MERVVITGLGLISPLGLNLKESWENCVEGRSGVGAITHFDTTDFKVKIAAQVPEGFDDLVAPRVKKRIRNQMTRSVQMCSVTTQMAVEDSGFDFSQGDSDRYGIAIGASGTDYPSDEMADVSVFNSSRIVRSMSNAFPAWISLHYGLTGPSFTVGTACSSAGYAMAFAYDQIALGLCDVMIAGGACCAIMPEFVAGFSDIQAMSEREAKPEEASCPFDARRDGFVMGEGSGVLILESLTSARKRGAHIYAELRRPALLGEAYNIVSPGPDGVGMARCMNVALKQAGLNPSDVDYINAHGTSTPLNDLYEAKAIQRTFGDDAKKIAISSTKSMTGHCLAAAGAVEAVLSCMAIETSTIPPTLNLNERDAGIDLDFVPLVSRHANVNAVLSNSFAFGGHNAVVPLVKFK